MPKKGGLGQFADFRGSWQERWGWCFWGRLIPQCTPWYRKRPVAWNRLIDFKVATLLKRNSEGNLSVSVSKVFYMWCIIRFGTICTIKKNVKSTHGGVLLLVKKPATLLKLALLHGCFSRFLNCTNGTKSRKASHIFQLLSSVSLLYFMFTLI